MPPFSSEPMTNNEGEPVEDASCRSVRRRRYREQTSTNSAPLRQQGDISEGAQNTMTGFDFDRLPQDILCHIHSLIPLRDAACLACLSRRFLRSWRCFPNLTFNQETFSLNVYEGTSYEKEKKPVDIIDSILQNHSGTGVKTLKLDVSNYFKPITADHINNWLNAAVKPGIIEIAVKFPVHNRPMFNLSCSLLSCAGSSLQSISLFFCAFHPTLRTGCFKSLRSVYFKFVHITSEELGCLLSSTVSLEKLEISNCDQLTSLNIPSHLQHLMVLNVLFCTNLKMIEIYAPKLTTFDFRGRPMKILTSDSSHLKYMTLHGTFFSGMIQYARTELHSIASNLQTLTLASSKEDFITPMLPVKFLHLRNLNVYFDGIRFQSYDYFSLSSFLEACPALETFYIWAGEYDLAWKDPALQDSNADSLQIRRIPEIHHANLKKVSINRFFPSKSLIELTYLIIENASSLQCLKLDAGYGFDTSGMCKRMNKLDVLNALSAVEVAKKYIEGKVPSSAKFNILEPCERRNRLTKGEAFNLNVCEGTSNEQAKKLVDRIGNILQNHSGTGVKTLKLDVSTCFKLITDDFINNWLHAAVKPGILEIAMKFSHDKPMFNLSCSLLSCAGSSLQSVSFFSCGFHPTLRTSYFKNLRSVYFKFVHITSEELGCLLSSTVSLEKLEIAGCDQLTFLSIPSHLQQLTVLHMIEIYAPKLTTFYFRGPPKILTGDSSCLKYMTLHGTYLSGIIQYARTKLHSLASNLQTLTLFSSKEAGEYDDVWQDPALEDSNADSLHIRRIPEFNHANLRRVSINRFFPSKSLIELTYLIIENASSLRCLKHMCKKMNKGGYVIQALKAVDAFKRYINGKVPSSVRFGALQAVPYCGTFPTLDVLKL
uniref:At1g61320/AtMIF1 LRR domain-containing protein n=1 Tax=Oryza glumipatula TaxID=40148 RepID=A0A0E0B6M1_9ORYZ